jgi:hypothetical protein
MPLSVHGPRAAGAWAPAVVVDPATVPANAPAPTVRMKSRRETLARPEAGSGSSGGGGAAESFEAMAHASLTANSEA